MNKEIKKRKIAILGSTGSIGTQALDVISKHADLFDTREVGGKVPSDFRKKETIFVPPSPLDDDSSDDGLPF